MNDIRRGQQIDFTVDQLHPQRTFLVDLHEFGVGHFFAAVLVVQRSVPESKILFDIGHIGGQPRYFFAIFRDHHIVLFFSMVEVLAKILLELSCRDYGFPLVVVGLHKATSYRIIP